MRTLEGLKNILSKVAIKWKNDNQMLANPSKFSVIVFTKSKKRVSYFQISAIVPLFGIFIQRNLKIK